MNVRIRVWLRRILLTGAVLVGLWCSFQFVAAITFGDSSAGTSVSVYFPQPAPMSATALSPDAPQILEALKLIDKVMVSNGHTTNEISEADRNHGILANYDGLFCGILLQSNCLSVSFIEEYTRNLSKSTKKLAGEVEETLRRRYGAANVKVND